MGPAGNIQEHSNVGNDIQKLSLLMSSVGETWFRVRERDGESLDIQCKILHWSDYAAALPPRSARPRRGHRSELAEVAVSAASCSAPISLRSQPVRP
jgi:hypothetical protein